MITNFPRSFVAQVSMTQPCFARGSETTAVSSLSSSRFLYVSLSPFVPSTKKTGQMIFFPSHFAKVLEDFFLRHLWYHFFEDTIFREIQFLRNLRNYVFPVEMLNYWKRKIFRNFNFTREMLVRQKKISESNYFNSND